MYDFTIQNSAFKRQGNKKRNIPPTQKMLAGKHNTNHKKNETPLFATVFVVLSILLHVSAYIGHPQVLNTQNVKKNCCMQY
jgi:hypothetical protein